LRQSIGIREIAAQGDGAAHHVKEIRGDGGDSNLLGRVVLERYGLAEVLDVRDALELKRRVPRRRMNRPPFACGARRLRQRRAGFLRIIRRYLPGTAFT
jgi:hypothetical protein